MARTKAKDQIMFAKLRSDAKIPTKRDEDGCYDIYPNFEENQIVISPLQEVKIPTGICSAFNKKYRMALRERGSNTKSMLKVNAGQIDSGYRGEWFVSVVNVSNKQIIIDKGVEDFETSTGGVLTTPTIRVPYTKAICQAAVEIVPDVDIVEATLDDIQNIKSERGTGKLGSSGK